MKKIVLIALLVLGLAGAAGAVGDGAGAADAMYKGKTHNVAWDAATLEDGSPCADCKYYLFVKNIKTGAQIQVGDVAGLSATLILPAEGRYRPGVQAYRIVAPEVPGEEQAPPDVSSISWADNPEVCAGGQTFWFRWFQQPLAPRGLRK